MTAEELVEKRKCLHMTITDMAQALNTPRSTYVKWERGERRVAGIVEIALESIEKRRRKCSTK